MLSTLFLIFFFVSLSRQQILSYQIHLILSILFFIFFKKVFLAFVTMQRINFHAYHSPTDKRRRRDLNPRAAINDLLPFQGSPFSHLGTSPAEFIKCIQFIELLLETEKVGFEPTAPFGVTGFQDRLLKPLGHLSKRCLNSIPKIQVLVNNFFLFLHQMKSQAINAKLYLRNIISSFCTTMFAFCWQICTDCPSFRFALCLFYSFYASLASSFWNSSPEVFHPNISLG